MFSLPFVAGLLLETGPLGTMAAGGVLRQMGTWAATVLAIAAFCVVVAVQTGDTVDTVVLSGLAAGNAALAIIGARASA